MATEFKTLLSNLGLSDSEAKVYLAGLELGASSVQDIAKTAGISRTAAYDAIAGLKKRGLLTTHQSGKKTVYAVEDADRMHNYLKEQKTAFNNQVELFSKNIADLKLLAGGEKPVVKFVQGGMETLEAHFADIQEKRPKVIYELTNLDDVRTHFTDETRRKAQIVYDPEKYKVKILYIGELKEKRKHVEYCELDKKEFGNFHGDIHVYGETVSFITLSEGVSLVIIENKIIAETMLRIMEELWKRCK